MQILKSRPARTLSDGCESNRFSRISAVAIIRVVLFVNGQSAQTRPRVPAVRELQWGREGDPLSRISSGASSLIDRNGSRILPVCGEGVPKRCRLSSRSSASFEAQTQLHLEQARRFCESPSLFCRNRLAFLSESRLARHIHLSSDVFGNPDVIL
jgi:hypothetical protein